MQQRVNGTKIAMRETAFDEDQIKRSSSFPVTMASQYSVILIIGNQNRQDLRRWLFPPDPSTNHNTARKTYHEGTATWFFRGGPFNEWKSGLSLLWIHGKRTSPPADSVALLCPRPRVRARPTRNKLSDKLMCVSWSRDSPPARWSSTVIFQHSVHSSDTVHSASTPQITSRWGCECPDSFFRGFAVQRKTRAISPREAFTYLRWTLDPGLYRTHYLHPSTARLCVYTFLHTYLAFKETTHDDDFSAQVPCCSPLFCLRCLCCTSRAQILACIEASVALVTDDS